jgi:hypothetical protein
VKNLSGVLIAAALIAVAGCAGSGPEARSGQRAEAPADPRAEYDAYRRNYAARKQQARLQDWEAMQQRAEQQLAEKERQDAVREAAVRRRWAAYQ